MHLNANPLELTTAATDVLLALLTVACIAIFRADRRRSRSRRAFLWTTIYLLMATGALLGVFAHGLALAPITKFWLWQPLFLSIGMAVGLIVAAAAMDCLGDRSLPGAAGIMVLGTLVFYACTLITKGGFSTFLVYEALCLSFALAAYLQLAVRGNHGASLLAIGIAFTLVAAAVQASKAVSMTLGSWPLDHNGVFHLVQMPAILLIALGVRWFDLCDACMEERGSDPHRELRGAESEVPAGRTVSIQQGL